MRQHVGGALESELTNVHMDTLVLIVLHRWYSGQGTGCISPLPPVDPLTPQNLNAPLPFSSFLSLSVLSRDQFKAYGWDSSRSDKSCHPDVHR